MGGGVVRRAAGPTRAQESLCSALRRTSFPRTGTTIFALHKPFAIPTAAKKKRFAASRRLETDSCTQDRTPPQPKSEGAEVSRAAGKGKALATTHGARLASASTIHPC